jgi:hypothetical protein
MADESTEQTPGASAETAEVSEAVEEFPKVKEKIVRNPFGKYGRQGRPDFVNLPDNIMSLEEQIRLVSKRLRRPSLPHKEFIDLLSKLDYLQNKRKARHPRSPNGVDIQAIQRKEAREKAKALAANKEQDHGSEQ